MDIPLVSICCCTYNHEKYIRQCLDGFVMQQTTFAFEILVHEDASTDNTANIIREYESKYPHLFRCVYQTVNQFAIQNTLVNILFKMANGKYIALCEGDDYWTDPYKLQKQVDFLEANGDFAGCFHDIYVEKEGILNTWKSYDKETFSIIDTFSAGALFHTSSFVFRKTAFYLPTWFSKIVSGDMAIFSIVASKGKLKRIPEFMSVYRKHSGGITATAEVINNFDQKRIELMTFLNKEFGFKYKKEIDKVISFHKYNIKSKSSIFIRLKQKLCSLIRI